MHNRNFLLTASYVELKITKMDPRYFLRKLLHLLKHNISSKLVLITSQQNVACLLTQEAAVTYKIPEGGGSPKFLRMGWGIRFSENSGSPSV